MRFMYEVGIATEVRAFHVMPGMIGPEGERHSHDYKIEVVAERAELDERGMVCDLDVLDAALRGTADKVRDADLDSVVGPASNDGVTVEAFARWVHSAMAGAVRQAGGEVLSIRVWESPVAFGGIRAEIV
jgi:6-pyruvoyltetrahydropterin/6-carboxytetrahydropterin synthase